MGFDVEVLPSRRQSQGGRSVSLFQGQQNLANDPGIKVESVVSVA